MGDVVEYKGELEDIVKDVFDAYDINTKHRQSIWAYLTILRNRDEATYHHSLRVGLRFVKVAEHLGIPVKSALYAGLLHDTGKILVDPALVDPDKPWTEQNREENLEAMKMHPVYSWMLLRGIHPFSAEIVLRHHLYKREEPYPDTIPSGAKTWDDEELEDIKKYAHRLALIDFYDASTTRNNGKFGTQNDDQQQQRLLNEYPDKSELIKLFYEKGLFGTSVKGLYGIKQPAEEESAETSQA